MQRATFVQHVRVSLRTLSFARLSLSVGALLLPAALALGTSASAATGKNRALTTAVKRWHTKGCAPPDTSMWVHGSRFNSLYGNCLAGDGHDQHVWFFDHGRFVGTDGLGTSSEVIGLWRDGTTFAFLYVLYRRQDALCCPTGGGKVVRFRWNGKRFRALDRPPPRQNGRIPVGR